MKQMIISAVSSSAGKTTISMGVMAALKKRGYHVAPFKVGPDYIDPMFHEKAAGSACNNLDHYMMGESGIEKIYNRGTSQSDAAVIEGVMGLYDGDGIGTSKGSTAYIAKLLKVPVILVIDGSSLAATAGAVVLGLKQYDKDVEICGVIVNKVSSQRHYDLIRSSIYDCTKLPCLGYLPTDDVMNFSSRHLGLEGDVLTEGSLIRRLTKMGEFLEKHLDIDQILTITDRDRVLPALSCETKIMKLNENSLKIGIARDKAFNFYYETNISLLKERGFHLVPFSPLNDKSLPENLDALYFGGGYPELHGEALQKNQAIRTEIRNLLEKGIPAFAECGGFMYLTKGIEGADGRYYEMVDYFQGYCKMTKSLQRFGYTAIDLGKYTMKGHEFHYSVWQGNKEWDSYALCRKYDGSEGQIYRTGQRKGNAFGSYVHIHLQSNEEIIDMFSEIIKHWREKNEK